MHLWTDEPIAMNVTHSPTVMVGQPDLVIGVADASRAVVEGARVTIYTDDYSIHDSGVTDASGSVTLHPNATSVGTLNVKVTANNHLVSNTTANIIPTSGVYLALDGYTIDDDTVDDSNGNDDGEVGAGEDIELLVTIGNFGTDIAYGVTATLSTTSSRVSFSDSYEEFGDITGGGFAQCLDDFELSIASDTPDGEVIALTLTMSDAATRETWESYINLIVHAPVLAYESHIVDDPEFGGNENGCPEPAEVVELGVTIGNSGSSVATGVTGTLSTSDPYVVINDAVGAIAFVNPDGTATFTPNFRVTILPSAPVDYDIDFDVAITGNWGYASSLQFSIRTLGNDHADDIESGEGMWTHGSVTAGFADEWHVETYASHSTSHSWKFGGSGSNVYANSADGALYMKPICLGTDGSMTFWHRMDAEEESSRLAWDCGLVEISTDGGATWNPLYPNGGYSHTKNDNAANPLPEGMPCWSGSFSLASGDVRPDELREFSDPDPVPVRFRRLRHGGGLVRRRHRSDLHRRADLGAGGRGGSQDVRAQAERSEPVQPCHGDPVSASERGPRQDRRVQHRRQAGHDARRRRAGRGRQGGHVGRHERGGREGRQRHLHVSDAGR